VAAPAHSICELTRSLAVRPQPVVVANYPTASYIENIGVQPDTLVDYMTLDNLLNRGAAFVQAFTNVAVKLLN
jgi:hypothetical protein